MKKTKKALASLAIAGMVLSMAPMSVFAAATNDRIAGADRIETAIKVAQNWTKSDVVIVAPAADANLVDALAAAPLAGQANAPILLTYGDALDAKTKQQIVDLKATKVYAVGALSQQVVTDLQGISGVTVEALKGTDRVDTAAKIAAKLTGVKGSFVVGYGALADALSVASYAAAKDMAILVANPDGTLPEAEKAFVGKDAYLLGGPTLVADGAVSGAERIAGANRFETNDKVAAKFLGDYSYAKVYVANGNDEHLVDSLVASSLAAKTDSAILLTDGASVEAAATVNPEVTEDSVVVALGGSSVVPDSVRDSVKYLVPSDLEVTSVKAINPLELQVVFNQAVDEDTAKDVNNYIFTINDTEKYGKDYTPVTSLLDFGADSIIDTADDNAVDFDADTNTVTFRLLPGKVLANGTKYSVDVRAGVLSEDKGTVVTKYADTQKTYSDTTAPKLIKAQMLSSKKLKLTFDEPVSKTNINTVNGLTATVDGVAVTLADPSTAIGDYTVSSTVALPTKQQESGSHTVAVYKAADVLAQNPNQTLIQTLTYNTSSDTTAPSVLEVKQVSNNARAFDVKFSEKVDLAAENVTIKKDGYTMPATGDTSSPGWTVGYRYDGDDITATKVVGTADTDTLRVTFNADNLATMKNPLYAEGEDTATLSITLKGYKDGVSLVGAEATNSLTMSKNMSAPLVESRYDNKITGTSDSKSDNAGTDGKLDIDFNKDLRVGAVDATKISVVDKDGVYRTIESASVIANDKDHLEIVLKDLKDVDNMEAKAPFTVTFNAGAVKDDAYAVKNVQFSTTVLENNRVVVPVVEAVQSVDFQTVANTIVVTYKEEMSASAAQLVNYTLDNAAMPAGTLISMNGANTVVTITLPKSYATTDIQRMLTISKDVVTKNGSAVVKSVNTKEAYTQMVSFVDNTKPTLVSGRYYIANANDTTTAKLRLVFSEKIAVASQADNFDDLKVVINGAEVKVTGLAVITDTALADSEKIVEVTLEKAYNIGQTATVSVVPVGDKNAAMKIADKAATPNTLAEGGSVTVTTAETR